MASWIIHLRIAELLESSLDITSHEEYYIGSVAPDFYIDTNKSHFYGDGDKSQIDYKKFYREFISTENNELKLSFLYGYYIHLAADVLWWNYVWLPVYEACKEEIGRDKNYTVIIKKDWKEADRLYLCNKEETGFYYWLKMMQNINYRNDSVDFSCINVISALNKYYADISAENPHETKFITPEKIDEIVLNIAKEIKFQMFS